MSLLQNRCEIGNDRKKIGKNSAGQTIFEGYADSSTGIEFKTVQTSNNAYEAVKNYFDSSLNKKNLKRLVIDNYESEYLADLDVIDAVNELSKKPEYAAVSKRVSLLNKEGNVVDIVRRY